ncbi:hypothetical protein BV221_14895 [Lactiplantibacillus plantarum]|nr:hypothetical protein GBO26_00125 [Pediococcus pentosaceus]QAB19405.1 hypothetical protein EPT60_00550 [Lactiplantibacillus plantarum]QAB25071.1 hypothetical protein EPT59_15485 [Lactiplantibacillus plantarum]TAQ99616.1 hypothetical protein BV221_14895 [Lactiplantibacillus plantarum]TAR03435.1 hypothetical protein BV228_14920 [Lactiplantibacillus plantarum]
MINLKSFIVRPPPTFGNSFKKSDSIKTALFRTCLDTLTFDLILVKLDQKQEFLIHEKLCTPL